MYKRQWCDIAGAFTETITIGAKSATINAESVNTNKALGDIKEDPPSSPAHENAISLPRPSYVAEKTWQHMSIDMRQELVDGVEKCLNSVLEKKRSKAVVFSLRKHSPHSVVLVLHVCTVAQVDDSVCFGDIVIIKKGFV